MKKIFAIIILSVMVFITLPSGIAMAYENAPDSVSLESVKWFKNEAGDMIGIFHYNIAYGTYPSTQASKTFEFRLYSGGSLVAASHPYVYAPFETNGYSHGVSSFYFDSDDEDIPTWGTATQLRIYGLPAYFEDPSLFVVNYSMTSGDYSSDDMADGIFDEIMDICEEFELIYPDVTLTEGGLILSEYGDTYFRNAIPGLQNLCPELFLIQAYTPEVMEVQKYDMSVGDTAAEIIVGSDLERGAERLGEPFGVSGTFVWGVVYFALCIFFFVWTAKRGWGTEIALLLCFISGLGFALIIGDLMFTLVMIGGLVAAMGIMYVLAYKRA